MRAVFSVLPIAAAICISVSGFAAAKTIPFSGVFSSEQEAVAPVPAGAIVPSGTVHGSLNTVTDQLSYKITYAGLSGAVLAAHFHGPAKAGANAGVLVPIPGPYRSGMAQSQKITAAEAAVIAAGKTYVNLHTAKNPNGEARAQIYPG